jgi:hypothetical protein
MSIVIYLALIVCLVGLIVWGMCVGVSKAWVAEVAKHAYWVGLLAFLMSSAGAISTCGTGVHGH